VDLYLDRQGVDTTTPGGRALFQMMGVFAEFERAMIQERVKAGLARGAKLGRPQISTRKERAIREAKAEGLSIRQIAARCSVGVGTVHNVLNKGPSA
jgi:DNA invertase Pin-like site-specific DNA recombinase